MPINPNIALQVRPLQLENPVNQLAKVMQVQGMQQDQQLGRMKMDEYRSGVERKNKLDALLQGGGDAEALRKGGFLKESLDWEKAGAEAAHKKAQTAKEEADAMTKRAGFYRDQLSSVTNPQQASAWLMAQYQDPVLGGVMQKLSPMEQATTQIPTDPQKFEEWRQQNALGLAKFMEYTTPTANTVLSSQTTMRGQDMTDKRTREEGAASRSVTLRGQNLTDARARERMEFDRSQPRGQIIETDGGFMLADPRGATAVPVMGSDGKPLKGKAANRQMTDSQAKANLFGSRMAESHRILNELEGQYFPLAVNAKTAAGDLPIVGGVAGAVGNLMLTSEGQQAEQAQRDFINAVLRRESGAVISQPEFENAKKQYFPQPNDDKKTLGQKRRNRELAIAGMAAEVPGGLRTAPSLTTPAGNSEIDELLKKYGGN